MTKTCAERILDRTQRPKRQPVVPSRALVPIEVRAEARTSRTREPGPRFKIAWPRPSRRAVMTGIAFLATAGAAWPVMTHAEQIGQSMSERAHAGWTAISSLAAGFAAMPDMAPAQTASTAAPAPVAATASADTCRENPMADGCFAGNVIRQGAFLCPDGARPVALEFASSPLRAAQGVSHRTAIAPSTGFITVLPATSRLNFITQDLRIPVDLVAFGRDGRILSIIPDVQPARAMPVNVPAADGLIVMRQGEGQRIRLTEECRFAAYEDGVPVDNTPASATKRPDADKPKTDRQAAKAAAKTASLP